ncbi:MAG: iron ABC transporter permease [Deltaproteobacteria bacterium]|nr:iron ABC transporter permease [Deltaproteobacteria bacterium]
MHLPRLNGQVTPLLPIALAPMALVAVFILVIVWVSVQTGTLGTAHSTYTLENYRDVLGDSEIYGVVWNTLWFACSTVFFALIIGLPIAWLTERTTIPGKPTIYVIMTLGLLIPGIFVAMGWTFIAHPRIGFINRWLVDLLALDDGPVNIATPVGMGFVQGLNLAPLAFILTTQMFRAMNPMLEEAARTAGMSAAATLRRVTIPLAMPAILAAVIYIFIVGIATFDVPAVIGLGNRVYLFSTYLFTLTFPEDLEPRYGITGAVGVLMIVLALALTAVYGRVLQRGNRYQVITGKGYRPKMLDLGRWNWAAWAMIGLYAVISKLVPIGLVGFIAFAPYVAPPSLEMWEQLSLNNFYNVNWELVWRGMKHTLILMFVVPVLVLVCAFAISWLVVRTRSRGRYALEFGAFLPHTVPELLFAIGALLVALFVLKDYVPLYGSVWLIALVYLVTRLPFATRALNGALLQVHKELEEAAYVSGLTMLRASRRVLLPLLRPTLMSVWIWTALLVYREVTVAVFLATESNITLTAVVWSYWAAAGMTEASVVTTLMILFFSPLLLLFWIFGRRSALAEQ